MINLNPLRVARAAAVAVQRIVSLLFSFSESHRVELAECRVTALRRRIAARVRYGLGQSSSLARKWQESCDQAWSCPPHAWPENPESPSPMPCGEPAPLRKEPAGLLWHQRALQGIRAILQTFASILRHSWRGAKQANDPSSPAAGGGSGGAQGGRP